MGIPADGGQDLRALARSLKDLYEAAAQMLAAERETIEVQRRVTAHLGCELAGVVPVSERFPTWEHVNLQRGVDAYLGAYGSTGTWWGISAAGTRPDQGLYDTIILAGRMGWVELGSPSFGTAPVGPDELTEVVELGLIASAAPDGSPVIITVQVVRDYGPPACNLEVFATSKEAAAATRAEIDKLMRVHDVYRGQVLSFTQSEHHGNELVTFLPRPSVPAGDVVLPDGVLSSIEQHASGIGELAAELLESGQHLKRGLLLHGPPGTGKTHTVRYLTGQLTGTTVILLAGMSIRFIEAAAALARRLQPSMVVLEDVDLVGADRDFTPMGNPLLFSLLEAMDGVGADADVTFMLTTNRADVLELALADRPGRVDLAIEIPRPDAECRERLLRLYARDLAVQADLAPVVAGTEGVTASFVKELIRRAVLVSLRSGSRPPVLRDSDFAEVLTEMGSEQHALTRSLLGSEGDTPEPGTPSASAQGGFMPMPGRAAMAYSSSLRVRRWGR